MYHLRVTAGSHSQGATYTDREGTKIKKKHAGPRFKKGDTFESETALHERWPEKFELVNATAAAEADYANMTVKQLRELAIENEIDLGDVRKKADIIQVIQEEL